ncbi:uncharacterized protein JCM15063_004499 [Sporobolomyces koalae]|uniref:uncharacterized protein n=1 Tax=Sporobolomyces koalae TaxID=500713 RepID=UPI003171D57C
MSGHHSHDPYSDPRAGLPPRPQVDYNDRDNHRARDWDRDRVPYERDQGDRHGGRDHRYDRDDYRRDRYDGPRGRSWHDEPRDFKRGRYEDEHFRPPPREDYTAPPYDYHQQQQHDQQYQHQQHQSYDFQGQGQEQYGSWDSPNGTPASAGALGGRKPPVRPEPPSASVVLLGLPAHVGDAHLRYFLEDLGASIESTTVIVDRATGQSKCYGFAKFNSVEHARAFVEPNFPSIPWKERGMPGPHDGMRIKINYSQKSGGWREDQGATARLTENQRRATEGTTSQGFYVNDGTRDVGSTPTQILLLRGLDALTNEEEIVAGLTRVGGRASGAIARGGVKKVFLTRDRGSRQSWGFAFVQFADVKLATEVLSSAFNAGLHPSGFRIRNRIIALSFTHENSFIPIYAKSEWSFRGEGGQQLAYWDDKGFVQPWLAPAPSQEELDRLPKGPKADEDAKMDKDMMAFLGELEDEFAEDLNQAAAAATAATSAIVAAAPPAALPAPGTIAPISIKPLATTSIPSGKSAALRAVAKSEVPAPGNVPAAGIVPAGPSNVPVKEKKGDLIISRKAAGNIAKWNVKQKELKVVPESSASSTAPSTVAASASAATSKPNPPATTATAQPLVPTASTSAAAPALAFDDPEFEHGDPIAFICLLCQRQFKGIEELRKHNKLSALHKEIRYLHLYSPCSATESMLTLTNLEKPEAVAACVNRKSAARTKHASKTTVQPASASNAEQPKYVDRAAARRSTYNQADHPEPPTKRKKFDAPEPPAPVPEAPNKDGLEETNAGMKMLEKMGWSKGAGLGSSGSGRVDPIQAAQFAQGAGLGSTKGVVVGSEDAKKGYAEKLRDRARDRLNEA